MVQGENERGGWKGSQIASRDNIAAAVRGERAAGDLRQRDAVTGVESSGRRFGSLAAAYPRPNFAVIYVKIFRAASLLFRPGPLLLPGRLLSRSAPKTFVRGSHPLPFTPPPPAASQEPKSGREPTREGPAKFPLTRGLWLSDFTLEFKESLATFRPESGNFGTTPWSRYSVSSWLSIGHFAGESKDAGDCDLSVCRNSSEFP